MAKTYSHEIILRAVCLETDILDSEVLAGVRTRPVVEARYLACWLARRFAHVQQWSSIARSYGMKHGSSASAGALWVDRAIPKDQVIAPLLLQIGQTLEEIAPDQDSAAR